jgi:hypothetical protein
LAFARDINDSNPYCGTLHHASPRILDHLAKSDEAPITVTALDDLYSVVYTAYSFLYPLKVSGLSRIRVYSEIKNFWHDHLVENKDGTWYQIYQLLKDQNSQKLGRQVYENIKTLFSLLM